MARYTIRMDSGTTEGHPMTWIVADDTQYYPSVEEFATEDEARAAFDKATTGKEGKVYLAEVKSSKWRTP